MNDRFGSYRSMTGLGRGCVKTSLLLKLAQDV
jgi:hypothetical protein